MSVTLPASPVVAAVESYARRRLEPLERALGGEVLADRFTHGRAAGHMTLELVEDLCDAIGQHPRMLYAQAWDQAAEQAARAAEARRRRTRRWTGRVLAEHHQQAATAAEGGAR